MRPEQITSILSRIPVLEIGQQPEPGGHFVGSEDELVFKVRRQKMAIGNGAVSVAVLMDIMGPCTDGLRLVDEFSSVCGLKPTPSEVPQQTENEYHYVLKEDDYPSSGPYPDSP